MKKRNSNESDIEADITYDNTFLTKGDIITAVLKHY